MLKNWSVTHLSEQLLPMSPVYTGSYLGEAGGGQIREIRDKNPLSGLFVHPVVKVLFRYSCFLFVYSCFYSWTVHCPSPIPKDLIQGSLWSPLFRGYSYPPSRILHFPCLALYTLPFIFSTLSAAYAPPSWAGVCG